MPGHRNACNVMSPSRPRGCVQANYQQLIPNLQFTYCISCMNEVNKGIGEGFGWVFALNRLSVHSVYQFLP